VNLDWRLIHRTEDDMTRLFQASAFASPCSNIRFEEQGINLFAVGFMTWQGEPEFFGKPVRSVPSAQPRPAS
jgi:hypothetical protein